MRRLGFVVLFLTALSLTTAMAASLEVQADNLSSTRNSVSISVPATPLPEVLYIRGAAQSPPGSIDLTPPPDNDSVTSALILLDGLGVQQQTDPAKYFTWQTPTAPAGGYLLSGTVTLYIEQNNGGTNRMSAGLFSCDASAAIDSADVSKCTPINLKVGEFGAAGSGYQERIVQFGTLGPLTIPAGNQLRLKIVNQSPASSADWNLQWGYLPARQSRLVITSP